MLKKPPSSWFLQTISMFGRTHSVFRRWRENQKILVPSYSTSWFSSSCSSSFFSKLPVNPETWIKPIQLMAHGSFLKHPSNGHIFLQRGAIRPTPNPTKNNSKTDLNVLWKSNKVEWEVENVVQNLYNHKINSAEKSKNLEQRCLVKRPKNIGLRTETYAHIKWTFSGIWMRVVTRQYSVNRKIHTKVAAVFSKKIRNNNCLSPESFSSVIYTSRRIEEASNLGSKKQLLDWFILKNRNEKWKLGSEIYFCTYRWFQHQGDSNLRRFYWGRIRG